MLYHNYRPQDRPQNCYSSQFAGSINEKDKPPVKVKQIEEPEIIAGQDVYVSDNMNDESSSIVTEPSTTVSYWYVSFSAHIKSSDASYNGYRVVVIQHPYFDINDAIHAIVPAYVEDDYVGITFFKRVPFETYKSFKEN